MRRLVVTTVLCAGLLGVSACAAPAPAPSKPAPELPAASVAYDQLPITTARPAPYSGACRQFKSDPELARKMGASRAVGGLGPSCTLQGDNHAIVVEKQAPDKIIDDPWGQAWNHVGYSEYFHRVILLGRYYAAYHVSVTLGGPGCKVTVNTGSRAVLQVSYKLTNVPPEAYATAKTDQAAELGRKTCPQAQSAAKTLLNTLDPGGGSRAST